MRATTYEVIEMTVAPTPLRTGSHLRTSPLRHGEHANQWLWLGGGALFAFLVPFLFADVINVSRDYYYAIYSLSVFALFAAWIRASRLNVHEFFARNWEWSVGLGLLAGGVLAAIVLREPATAHHAVAGRLTGREWNRPLPCQEVTSDETRFHRQPADVSACSTSVEQEDESPFVGLLQVGAA